MKGFKIALAQINAIPSNKDLNLQKISKFVTEAAKEKAKIICFPELSTCGYHRNLPINLSENIMGFTSIKLLKMSKDKNIVIIAGMLEKDRNNTYITQVIAFPDGKIEKYRKTHLGKYERKKYSPGQNLPIFKTKDTQYQVETVNFGIGICYDLHFPEVVSSLSIQGAHIIFAPHASPIPIKKRFEIWEKYMGARAYDNRVYLVACNLIGNNGYKKFGGGIGIWDPFGNLVKKYTKENEGILSFDVDFDILDNIRKNKSEHMKTPFFLKDRRTDLYL